MQTIYVDVLIILNIYVNFILILAASRITHSKVSNTRGISAAIYGSFYSLMILLPEMSNILNMLIKLFAAVTIVIIAFGFGNVRRLLINTVCFFTVNFIFGGVIFAVYIWLKPSFIHFNNTYFYIDFSLLLLIFITSFLYTALSIFRYFSDRFSSLRDDYSIIIKYNNKTLLLEGLADTGNSLVDFFSGKPVIICSCEKLKEIIDLSGIKSPDDFLELKGFRLIPYSTISDSGMIPVFTPQEVMVINESTHYRKKADVLIGMNTNVDKAVFNPKILEH